MTHFLILFYIALVGACVGSFLNVCVVRWPRELSVVRPRSRCPTCGYHIAWYDNIPVVSWTVLRGKCRCCGESISALYPIVELTVALGWLAAALEFGVTFTALRVAVAGTILLGVALTDAREYLIPDGFTLTGLIWAIATAAVAFFRGDETMFAGPYDALVGACAGAGVVAIVGWVGEIIAQREAMGLGDVTLMAFVGAMVGPGRAFLTVFLGAALGSVVHGLIIYPVAWFRRNKRHEQTELALGHTRVEMPLVPFGLFLAPAAMVALLWGDAIVQWLKHGY